jgi:hypothetical protein
MLVIVMLCSVELGGNNVKKDVIGSIGLPVSVLSMHPDEVT